jgi:putative serine protease PepD
MDIFDTPSDEPGQEPTRVPSYGPGTAPDYGPGSEPDGQAYSAATSFGTATGPVPPAGPAGRPGRITGWRRVAVPLVSALLGSAIGSAATLASHGSAAGTTQAPTVVRSVSQASQTLTGVAAVADDVLPSVVQIDVKSRTGSRFFGGYVTSSTGSGVIYRSDGYILTNRHVVEGADSIEVTFSNGDKASATLVGTTNDGDIGVIKVGRTGLKAATFGSAAGLHVGDVAVAIGSPFGLEGTVTSGVVSALHRSIDEDSGVTLGNVIQTDAPINPGNSGGALADASGAVIGINTAIVGTRGGSVGVGFAIPVDVALDQARQIIASGT